MGIAVIFLVVLGIIWIFGDKESSEDQDSEESGFVRPEEEFDAMAGGFPVPPLPGQSLPPSPRASRHQNTQEGELV